MIGQLRALLPLSSPACRGAATALLQTAQQPLQSRSYAGGSQDGAPTTSTPQGKMPKSKEHFYTNPEQGEAPPEPRAPADGLRRPDGPEVIDYGVEREIPESHKRNKGGADASGGVKGGQNPVSTDNIKETPDKPRTK